MSVGTKRRQQQTAELCKQHLREKHRDKLALVEEYIVEVEGTGKSQDITQWDRFADLKRVDEEMLKRVDEDFEKWLNP